jgi:hypothetical protein
MACSRRSAVNLVCNWFWLGPCCAAGRLPTEEHMESSSTFTHVQLDCRLPHGSARLVWGTLRQVSLAVRFVWQGAAANVERHFGLPADRADALGRLLSELLLAPPALPAAPDFHLRVKPPLVTPRDLKWSEIEETAACRAFRLALEDACHLRYGQALAALQVARRLSAAQQIPEAIRVLNAGIDVLGDRYWVPDLIDDTRMKRIVAEHDQRAGRLEQAASLLEGVLDARTAVYAQRIPAVTQ